MNDYPLTLEDVTAGYRDRTVLHGINASFAPGQISALIGPNGSGKSTLIRVASGVLPLQSGRIMINGYEVGRQDPASRAKLVSVIPQAKNLPPAFTVREVVTMGRTAYAGWFGNYSSEDMDITEYALKRTETQALAERRIGEVSGGEAQRVLIARAVAQQSHVMLLDEPTTHLDIHYQLSVLDLLQDLAKVDRIVVVAALHDLNLVARYADSASLLVNGRLHASGTPAQILTPGLLKEGYAVEMEVINARRPGHPLVFPAANQAENR